MTNTFEDFVNKRSNPSGESGAYHEMQLKEWIADLDALYIQLHGYLQEYTEKDKIIILTEQHTIQEQMLGRYATTALRIGFVGDGNAQVRVIPYGRHVIASKGRVDIEGPKGSAMLIRVPEDAESPQIITNIDTNSRYLPSKEVKENTKDVWKFAIREPHLRFYPLTKDTFQNVLMKLVDG